MFSIRMEMTDMSSADHHRRTCVLHQEQEFCSRHKTSKWKTHFFLKQANALFGNATTPFENKISGLIRKSNQTNAKVLFFSKAILKSRWL